MKRITIIAALILVGAFALTQFSDLNIFASESSKPLAVEGEQGAPFDDPNFKLVVMDALMVNGEIDFGESWEFLAFVLKQPVDDPYDLGYEMIQPAYDSLVRYPLTEAQLAIVEQISFDGGLDIYFFAYPGWSGETEEFDVRSIAGIDQLPNLKSFGLASMVPQIDLNDLATLSKLETLDVGVTVENLSALLEMPALKKVSLMGDDLFEQVSTPNHPTRKVFETLKKRGVKVWVHWMSWIGDDRPPAFE